MPEIMKANVLEPSCSTDTKPDFVHTPKGPVLLLSMKYMRIVRYARQTHENL